MRAELLADQFARRAAADVVEHVHALADHAVDRQHGDRPSDFCTSRARFWVMRATSSAE
jgi:hypothetical protein